MPSVFTFSRSESEIHEELLRVLSGPGTAREQWSSQAKLVVEPVGWDALWKLSKTFCKRFEVGFPCIAYVSVTSVDFEALTASADVLIVQHETASLPEIVADIPLIELWPTVKQRDQCVNAATTADFIDLLRHRGAIECDAKPAAARRLLFNTESADRVPVAVPSTSPFDEELKLIRSARARDKVNLKKMTKDQLNTYKELRERKELQYSMMPDAPSPTRKRKKASPPRRPCRLVAGVPEVPPAGVSEPSGPSRGKRIVADPGERMDEDNGANVIKKKKKKGTPLHSPVMISHQLHKNESTTVRCERPETENQQTPAQKKPVIFLPENLVIKASKTPTSTVEANIELIGFTSNEDVLERELEVPVGSDVDDDLDIDLNQDGFVDTTLRTRTENEFPVLDEEELGREIYLDALALDSEDDTALRNMVLDPSYLKFDWSAHPETFEGVREVFREDTGPTFSVKGLSPLDIFKKIWDEDVMANIVLNTNRYAHQLISKSPKPKSRLTRWTDITTNELWTFFAITMAHSLAPSAVEREYWYPKLAILKIGNFNDIMPYDRFLLIKKCLHFVDSSRVPQVPHKLAKILPIIQHLNRKFESLYVPEQNIALDESLLLWKGRLSFAQMIKNKKAQVGLKTYEVCESRTGYLWKMDLYAGKSEPHSIDIERHNNGEEPEVELEGATSQIVLKLVRPLLNKGYTLVMDNFYNSPLLTRILKKQYRTDTMGTLRLNREFLPDSLKTKTKSTMRIGEICSSCTKDMSVVMWRDSNVVTMISSFHPVTVGGREKNGVYKYRPQVVLDYNNSMGGVDKKDQMLHAYPVERVRNQFWYKKLFRRLLNVSIHNALVLFRYRTEISNRNFRIKLLDEIMTRHPPEVVKRSPKKLPPTPAAHVTVKGTKWQRCKLCAQKRVRKTTHWTCKTCQVHLCIAPCFEEYHK